MAAFPHRRARGHRRRPPASVPGERRQRQVLASLRARFGERISAPRFWLRIAVDAPRLPLSLVLALLPVLAILGYALTAGPGALEAITGGSHVRDAFARLTSAVATASAIAVSVATLSLNRELRGTGALRRHREENEALLDRIVDARREDAELPLGLSGVMAVAMTRVQESAARILQDAPPGSQRAEVDGVPLRSFLMTLEATLDRAQAELRSGRGSPTRLYRTLVDFNEAAADHMTRRYTGHPGVDARTRDGLVRLRHHLDDVVVGTGYAKTMEVQWGLSRMSVAILVALPVALAASIGAALAYDDGVPADLGMGGAAGAVGLLLWLTLLPIGAIVSYLLRFVVLNQYTLSTPGMRIGPEETLARE